MNRLMRVGVALSLAASFVGGAVVAKDKEVKALDVTNSKPSFMSHNKTRVGVRIGGHVAGFALASEAVYFAIKVSAAKKAVENKCIENEADYGHGTFYKNIWTGKLGQAPTIAFYVAQAAVHIGGVFGWNWLVNGGLNTWKYARSDSDVLAYAARDFAKAFKEADKDKAKETAACADLEKAFKSIFELNDKGELADKSTAKLLKPVAKFDKYNEEDLKAEKAVNFEDFTAAVAEELTKEKK
jgi:hypothetical protein